MNVLKEIRTHVVKPETSIRRSQPLFKIFSRELLYPPVFWFLSHRYNVPGLHIQAIIYFLGLQLFSRGKWRLVLSQKLLSSPMDSVRYFEFDFFLRGLLFGADFQTYLDVSSPRLFPVLFLRKFSNVEATIVNPDEKDLKITKELIAACGLTDRCRVIRVLISDLKLPEGSFDLISSISAIEHIPGDGDIFALEKMWRLLRPCGKLFISVPCAREAFEEYIDYNEYGLLESDECSYVFGQRFYNERLLEDRFWKITGRPHRMAIYGEKQKGFFIKSRQERLESANYPFWREPQTMGIHYRFYNSIDELPGWGVIAMEFVK